MKLRLFRSLVALPRLPRVPSLLGNHFDGLEVSLPQLEATPTLLDECAESSLRMICRLEPLADADDAESQLHRLSSRLSSRPAEAAAALELVVMAAPSKDLDAALSYLRDIQPFWSEFLEAHTTVGSRHGKKNAHGKPLNNHVLGVCQQMDLGAAEIADVVEILTPTRVALTSRNLAASLHSEPLLASATRYGSLPTCFEGLSDELESVLETSDLLFVDPSEAEPQHAPLHALWDEAWAAQQLSGAGEVYASCGAGSDGDAAEAAALRLASMLRRRFDEGADWRAHTGERRAARDAAAAARRRSAPTSTIGGAAKAFELLPTEIDSLNEAFLKARWRQLALRAHPDVAGGSGERFQELRAAYKVLLRAARS